MPRPPLRLLLLAVPLVGVGLWWALPGRSGPPEADTSAPHIGRFPASQFYMQHDLFLAATDPRTVPAGEAAFLRPDDEVFGVVLGGRARAYPVHMISYHHVVNDVIRGIPIAVTY